MARDQIIILEDNFERQQQMSIRLTDRSPPCPVTFFRTAPEMLAVLPQQLAFCRLISLDNDLERIGKDNADPGEGRDIARYLIGQRPVWRSSSTQLTPMLPSRWKQSLRKLAGLSSA